jgi:chromosome segregation protein
MRLSKIKLAGFKSFVDPTTIHLPSSLVGIVGPNGCGKSNVIDAVRWVMGESSAKSLRGESMADVIFKGSSGRKPVSHAAIELVFDNSDGSLGGQYAQYAEISIKRQVGLDGQSDYFLNGTRCRRRDITDIFLGTGLGPHSYAIIEQNMISRLIEAKPEELRVFLEEAAGISRYKERRRETETRIKHTRENLEQVSVLREELGKQLERLQRQSKTAEKYKELRQRERQTRAELLALRWRTLSVEAQQQDRRIGEQETQLQAHLAEQRNIEAAIEKQRTQQGEASEDFNKVQAQFYSVGAEIARLEQAIGHARERRREQQQDLEQLGQDSLGLQKHLETDHHQLAELGLALADSEPEWQRACAMEQASSELLAQAEHDMQAWHVEWEAFNERASLPAQTAQVERARMEQLQQQVQQYTVRLARLTEEKSTSSSTVLEDEVGRLTEQQLDQLHAAQQMQETLQALIKRITELRSRQQQLATQLDSERSDLETQRGRLASLEALQEAALGKRQETVETWLKDHALHEAPRLAQHLRVDAGWERAVECVLGFHLEAVCVDGMDKMAGLLEGLQQGSLGLFDTAATVAVPQSGSTASRLQEKVRAPWRLDNLFAGVYLADNMTDALALRDTLDAQESVVTKDGIWLGSNWLRVRHGGDNKLGVLNREQELTTLTAHVRQLGEQLARRQALSDEVHQELQTLEMQRETSQRTLDQINRAHAELQAQLSSKQTRLEQTHERQDNVRAEIEEIQDELAQIEADQVTSRGVLARALMEAGDLEQKKQTLLLQRDKYRAALDQQRTAARADHDTAHQLALRIESLRTASNAAQQRLERMQTQEGQLVIRRTELTASLAANDEQLTILQTDLEQVLGQRVQVEAELSQARGQVETLEHGLRQFEQQRHAAEETVQQCRALLETLRIARQEIKVRGETLQEQIREADFETDSLLETLDNQASEQVWQENLDQLAQKIQRLGPINLAAIDEFAEQSERKNYLDAQFNDLSEALNTLEDAIRKIDKETRARFKDTFDRVSHGLQNLFPRLFGGGQAYLELSGEDLLSTGVTVMARPPGKRISSIHLLSGGEKALTAVALVFAIFELNPAPFCMLDEVDASLDEANVGRFSNLVKEMSERIQFIYITHNKATMEIAQHLTGITMQEPGVSRLVAVDVDEAAALVAVA